MLFLASAATFSSGSVRSPLPLRSRYSVSPSRTSQTRVFASGPKTSKQYSGALVLYRGSFAMERSIRVKSAVQALEVRMSHVRSVNNKRDTDDLLVSKPGRINHG